jgi:hypothetical protein
MCVDASSRLSLVMPLGIAATTVRPRADDPRAQFLLQAGPCAACWATDLGVCVGIHTLFNLYYRLQIVLLLLLLL